MKKTLNAIKSFALATLALLLVFGVDASQAKAWSASEIQDGELISADYRDSNGHLKPESLDIYIVKRVGDLQFKRLILNPHVFESYGHLRWNNVKKVEPALMDQFITSSLVRVDGDTRVWGLTPYGDVGDKAWVNLSSEDFYKGGGRWEAIYTINAVDGGYYRQIQDIRWADELRNKFDREILYGTFDRNANRVDFVADKVADATATNKQKVDLWEGKIVVEKGSVKWKKYEWVNEGNVKLGELRWTVDATYGAKLSNIELVVDGKLVTGSVSFNLDTFLLVDGAGFELSPGVHSVALTGTLEGDSGASVQTVFMSNFSKVIDAYGVSMYPLSSQYLYRKVSVVGGTTSPTPITPPVVTDKAATFNAAIISRSNSSVAAGAKGVVIWENTLNVENRAATLTAWAAAQSGTLSTAYLKNFTCYVDGKKIDTVTSIGGYFVKCDVPVNLTVGKHTMKITADIASGAPSGKTVALRMPSNDEIEGKDSVTGKWLTPQGSYPLNYATITIK